MSHQHSRHPYLISNSQTAIAGEASIVMAHARPGDPQKFYEIDAAEWVMHPGGEDVAAVSLRDHLTSVSDFAGAFSEAEFICPQRIADWDVGIGDEVVMMDRSAIPRGNGPGMPAVRFGRISAIPEAGPSGPLDADGVPFAVEMCARVALPGSPVLVCRSSAAGDSHESFNCRVGLLGISCGYIFDEGGVNTGLNRVLPAWRISELLDAPALQADRCGEPPARAACACAACTESPYSDPGVGNTAAARDAILRSMLATPPVARKSR